MKCFCLGADKRPTILHFLLYIEILSLNTLLIKSFFFKNIENSLILVFIDNIKVTLFFSYFLIKKISYITIWIITRF